MLDIDSESTSCLVDRLLYTGRSCGWFSSLEKFLHNSRNIGPEDGAVCNRLCPLASTLSAAGGVENSRVTTPAESRRFPRSEIITGIADETLPMLTIPLIKPLTRPVIGSVSTPCGIGGGLGAGAAAGAGGGAGRAITIGAAASKTAGGMRRRKGVGRARENRWYIQRE